MKDDLYQKYTYEKLKLNQKVHIYDIRKSMRKGGKINGKTIADQFYLNLYNFGMLRLWHTVRNCKQYLLGMKTSGCEKQWCENLFSTDVKCTNIHQNMQYFISKFLWNICQNVNSTKNTATLAILQKIRWSPQYNSPETLL
jgi:hypothetical protein